MPNSPRERVLFFSIWGLLILGAAIYFCWPKSPVITQTTPDVILGSELASWFVQAKVTTVTTASFKIDVQLQDRYVQDRSLDDREILLAYHFLGEQSVLAQGVIPVKIQPKGLIQLEIPNSKHIAPRTIQLSLAH